MLFKLKAVPMDAGCGCECVIGVGFGVERGTLKLTFRILQHYSAYILIHANCRVLNKWISTGEFCVLFVV